MTLPHFSVSAAMSLPKLVAEPPSGVQPKSASRAAQPGKAGDQPQTDGVFADEEDNRGRRGRSFGRKCSRPHVG
jgi:hypothetical protein